MDFTLLIAPLNHREGIILVKLNVGAIILAGGKSSRMGKDKGFVELNNQPFIQWVIQAVVPITTNIIISANNPTYQQFGYPVFEDLIPDKGPMGGLYTGLTNSNFDLNLVLSCDIPSINSELLHYLYSQIQPDRSANMITHNGYIEPLCGVYHKKCLPTLKELLSRNMLSLNEFLTQSDTHFIEISDQPFYHDKILMNFNTPEDIRAASN